jgi:organic radical activating enzyme
MVLTQRALIDDFDMRKAVLAYERRERAGVLGTDAAIWELEIHPTNFCNLKCVGCSYADRHDHTTIDATRLAALVHHYRQYDLRSVFVSGGGDPSYWSGWHRVFGNMDCSSFKIGVSTNLSNLQQIGKVFEKISLFQIHVVGYDAESTIRETGADCFDTIRTNLDYLFSHRSGEQQVTMKVLVKNGNLDDLPAFLDFIGGYPCDTVVLKVQQNFLRNVTEFDGGNNAHVRDLVLSHPTQERFDLALDNLPDSLYQPAGASVLSVCELATSGLYRPITAEGLVFPCVAATYSRENSRGNLADIDAHGAVSWRSGRWIDPSACPIQACRHYRCSLEIADYLAGEGSRLGTDPWLPQKEPSLL